MLDYHSKLPRHLVVSNPVDLSSQGGEKTDLEVDLEVDGDFCTTNLEIRKMASISTTNIASPLPSPGRLVGMEFQLKARRGLNSVSHQAAVGQLVRDNNIQFLGLLETRRRELWAGLLSLSEDISDDAWCILGDFNVVCDTTRGVGEFGNVFPEYWSMKPGATWRHIIHGSQMYGVITKLKALKPVFRAQRKVRGDLSNNVRLAKDFLVKAQTLFDTYKEATLLQLVKLCQVTYCTAVQQESSMLQQRAKMNWLKHGDQNSKIFFKKINARRARQRICQITSVTEADALISPVTFAKIKEAFFDISEDNALGLDGYSSAFFKAAWPVIGDDVCATVMEFFQSGRLLKQFNNTLLALIPKVQLPTRVSDFRPISCCNVLYKAITKILVRRLQKVLHLLIDYSQNAFIPGRSIADNVMLAQELLAGYNQNKLPPRCTIKVDIQKAYDSVSWDFILESLRIFNFPTRFIGWIEQCITIASFSVSLNGSIHGFFQGARGIRQGDPMSPYLFVMVMELWHVLLQLQVQQAPNFQYHWKCQGLGILNLCFADDVLIFGSGNTHSVSIIKDSLAEFVAMSGLHVNPSKSQIILSKSVRSERQSILDLMGFQEGTLIIKYLGVPLVASRLTIADCQPLLLKIEGRLAGAPRVTAMQKFHGLKYASQRRRVASKKLVKLSTSLRAGLEYKVGDGQTFKLWIDIWHPQGPLIQRFPRGPVITGLPTDSLLKNVIQHGSWNRPSETDFDIQEIIAESHEHLFFDCLYSSRCITILKLHVRFQWLGLGWRRDIIWASKRWRGKHLLNSAARTLLASLTYNIWMERNRRKFKSTAASADLVARKAIEDVRLRIIGDTINPSLQQLVLYRIWKIPWDRD
ncbi:UNVERIFIED_CONTAM: LINE-1 reverse transcriptase [Sesamum latifolium]|uniref:LINE-1 reverse transcriptase n=1 Tax=Sesamum latifolium TaxID=2727402 RepID=A0AAW2WDD8_9LAMI